MATTQLSDVFVPEVYSDYKAEDTAELTAFANSGVLVNSPEISAMAGSGGIIGEMPVWGDLADSEPNYSTDNPADTATPNKIGTKLLKFRSRAMNNGWQSADLTTEIGGAEPMSRIAARTDQWWARNFQKDALSVAEGVRANNVANDSSDMVFDASIADGANAASANLFSLNNFTSAAFTMGDRVDGVTAMAVHSVVFKRMVDNNDIDTIKGSDGTTVIHSFMGRRVIIDDGMTVVAGGTSGYVYTSILFGAGVLGYGNGNVKTPVEIERVAGDGNGGGIETLWERKSLVIQPAGHQWADASVAGQSPNRAELALAANWTRSFERKNVPMAFLLTNG